MSSMKSSSAGIAFGFIALFLITSDTASAQSGEGNPRCAIGAKFDPGPIVKGHPRQPTPREFDARMQILQEQAKIRAIFGCDALP
jgi:hypothetical protein